MMDVVEVAAAERLCAGAMGWLHTSRERFTLPAEVPAELVEVSVFKALSELALAGWIVRREAAAGTSTMGLALDLLDHVWAQFGQGDVLYRMLHRNPAATHAIETYSILHAAGYRHPALWELAAHLVNLRAFRFLELVPNRQLAVSAAFRRMDLTPWVSPAELIGQTWLGGMPEPWMLDTVNGYSLTHTVFHLTEHGADPDGLPAPLRAYLDQWLPVWLDVYAESGFWDLLGELLVVLAEAALPMADPRPWRLFVQAQHGDGMTPNGINRPIADARQRAMTNYHPTTVAALAGTMVASRGLTVMAG